MSNDNNGIPKPSRYPWQFTRHDAPTVPPLHPPDEDGEHGESAPAEDDSRWPVVTTDSPTLPGQVWGPDQPDEPEEDSPDSDQHK